MTGQEQGDSKAAANRRHWSVRLIAVLVLLASLALFAMLALTGRPLTAPGWVVSEVESRVNAALEGQARVTLGAAEVIVDKAWVPRVRLRDVTLISSHDEKLATVPELRIAFAPQPILRGKLRPRSLRLRGGHLNVTRARDGSVNLALNASALQPGRTRSLGEILDRIDEVMATPALSELTRVDAEALTLSFDDARAGRLWQVRDGRLSATRGAEEMSTSLAFDLAGAGEAPAKAELSFVSNRKTSAAQLGVTLANVPARELALQAPALTWLSVLDAPISGSFRMGIDAGGALGTLDGTIAIGAGAVRPVATAPAVPLKGGKVYISYQPGAEKVNFSDITLESAALRLRAAGSAYLRDMQSGLPRTLLAQFRISELTVDPDGYSRHRRGSPKGRWTCGSGLTPSRSISGRWRWSTGTARFAPMAGWFRWPRLAMARRAAGRSGWTSGSIRCRATVSWRFGRSGWRRRRGAGRWRTSRPGSCATSTARSGLPRGRAAPVAWL
ncbi:MAG: hypothetical protein R3D84_13745 [Paracoccaceae bacterium]